MNNFENVQRDMNDEAKRMEILNALAENESDPRKKEYLINNADEINARLEELEKISGMSAEEIFDGYGALMQELNGRSVEDYAVQFAQNTDADPGMIDNIQNDLEGTLKQFCNKARFPNVAKKVVSILMAVTLLNLGAAKETQAAEVHLVKSRDVIDMADDGNEKDVVNLETVQVRGGQRVALLGDEIKNDKNDRNNVERQVDISSKNRVSGGTYGGQNVHTGEVWLDGKKVSK